MPIQPQDLVTVIKGKPLWRSMSGDEIVGWHHSEEAKGTMPDGSPRRPPEGKLVSSDGTTRYRVLFLNRTSQIFGSERSKCAVIQAKKGPKWFCYMADLESDNESMPSGSDNEDVCAELLEELSSDREPLPVGRYEDDGFGQRDFVPFTKEEIADRELDRSERNAKRLQFALAEFKELDLEIARRVREINKKYGLLDNWVGILQVRVMETTK